MFDFIFSRKEGVSLADALAAKSDDALEATLGMLTVPPEGSPSRAECESLAREAFAAKPEIPERLFVSLPDTIWTVLYAAVEKGPQTLEMPSGLDDAGRAIVADGLGKMYAGLPFAHVFPAQAGADAPRVAVVDEMRALWKAHRRELLARRADVERLNRLAAAAANLYGCIDVGRFATLLGEAVPAWCAGDLETLLDTGALSIKVGFMYRDGEILHAELEKDRAAHMRVRRAHVGKEPRALPPEELIAFSDEKAVFPQELMRQAVRALECALPKALAGEAKDVATGFAQGCRRGDDVAELMRGFMALARMSVSGDGAFDLSALTPLYNGVPLWEEFGCTREQAGKAAPFRVDGGTDSGTQTREGPQVGRNDPCPCGSGKKYKKCCGRGL